MVELLLGRFPGLAKRNEFDGLAIKLALRFVISYYYLDLRDQLKIKIIRYASTIASICFT